MNRRERRKNSPAAGWVWMWGAALILVMAGCAVPGPKAIQFGLYGVPVEAMPEVKRAGFDVVTGPYSTNSEAYLNAAREAGLGVLLSTRAFSSDREGTRRDLERYDAHPATWGWYLIDEPDLHDVPPERVRKVTREFQRRARKPGVVVLASGTAAKEYGRECDLLMVDFYPVPWAPVSRFGKEMRLADYARGEKPYMGVVQAFDWTHFQDVLGETNELRAPRIEEIRSMSYMALAHEARGLFFYTYAARGWRLAEEELWLELKELMGELRAHSVLFEEPPVWFPTEVEYGDPERMYNEVHDGVMLARLYQVKTKGKGLEPGYYFLLINTTGEEVEFDLRLPFGDPAVRCGGEELLLEDGWVRRKYEPHEVAILGPLRERKF